MADWNFVNNFYAVICLWEWYMDRWSRLRMIIDPSHENSWDSKYYFVDKTEKFKVFLFPL